MAGTHFPSACPGGPISASKPSGVTPSTAAARYAAGQGRDTRAAVPATSTVLPSPTYAAAQPGAGVGPAPTGIPQGPLTSKPMATMTQPVSSNQTTSSPPPPQPGAVPSPFYSKSRRPSIPPPPKAGEIPKSGGYKVSHYDGNPMLSHQALSLDTAVPPLAAHQTHGALITPTRAQPPAAVTSVGLPTTVTLDLSHPPGYVQDARASFSDRPPEHVSPISQKQNGHTRGRSGNGILDGGGANEEIEDKDKGIWDTAMSWAKTVGQKIIESEEDVWKRINREK